MTHHEHHAAAQVLGHELTATRNFFAALRNLIATKVSAPSTRKAKGADVFEDLYYPNDNALRP